QRVPDFIELERLDDRDYEFHLPTLLLSLRKSADSFGSNMLDAVQPSAGMTSLAQLVIKCCARRSRHTRKRKSWSSACPGAKKA
ncbi:MAG TPA: hypothetical protein VIE47_10205, partial [Methylocystis sp.]